MNVAIGRVSTEAVSKQEALEHGLGGGAAGRPRVVIYTALAGGYDVLLPSPFVDAEARYVLLTDRRPLIRGAWEVRPLPPEVRGMDPGAANRWCKFFPHRIFGDADLSVYVDANVRQVSSFRPYIEELLESGRDIGLFAHRCRRSIREEYERCRQVGKIGPDEAELYLRRMETYLECSDRFPELFSENSVILRDHRSPRLQAAMEAWWSEFERGIRRDQISLPWVLGSHAVREMILNRNFRDCTPPLVEVVNHRRSEGFFRDFYHIARHLRRESGMMALSYQVLETLRRLRRRALRIPLDEAEA
jgi:hypothetical protein